MDISEVECLKFEDNVVLHVTMHFGSLLLSG